MLVKRYARHIKPLEMINRRHAHKVDDNHYKVYGRNGEPYNIFVVFDKTGRALSLACPCHAGSYQEPCFHAAVVVRRLMREKKIGR